MTTPDPLEVLERRLFDAARSEALPEGAEERVVSAALKRRAAARTLPRAESRGAVWWLLAAAVLSGALFLALSRKKDGPVAIGAEPSRPAEAPRRPASPPEEPSAAVIPNLTPREAPPRVLSPKPSPPTTLADELAALKRAESALGAGDAKGALAELDRYDGVLHGKQMRAEATLLRLEALSRAGRADAAAALAARFVAENPGSPLVDRARSFLNNAGPEKPGAAP